MNKNLHALSAPSPPAPPRRSRVTLIFPLPLYHSTTYVWCPFFTAEWSTYFTTTTTSNCSVAVARAYSSVIIVCRTRAARSVHASLLRPPPLGGCFLDACFHVDAVHPPVQNTEVVTTVQTNQKRRCRPIKSDGADQSKATLLTNLYKTQKI